MVLLKRTEIKNEQEYLSQLFGWRKTKQQQKKSITPPPLISLHFSKQKKKALNNLKIYCAYEKFYKLIRHNLICIPGCKIWARQSRRTEILCIISLLFGIEMTIFLQTILNGWINNTSTFADLKAVDIAGIHLAVKKSWGSSSNPVSCTLNNHVHQSPQVTT